MTTKPDIYTDIRNTKEIYGNLKGIQSAERIMRIVSALEKRNYQCEKCPTRKTCEAWKGEQHG